MSKRKLTLVKALGFRKAQRINMKTACENPSSQINYFSYVSMQMPKYRFLT